MIWICAGILYFAGSYLIFTRIDNRELDPENRWERTWKTAVAVGLVPFMVLALLAYLIVHLIQFWGAPSGCCRCHCKACPWGNIKLAKYRKNHRKDRCQPRLKKEEITPR